jgi:predicted transcriptional regulator
MSVTTTNVVNENYTPSEREEKILALLKDGREAGDPWGRVTIKYVSERLDIRRQYVNRDLGSLVSAGWVVKPVKGLYEFVEDPRE